MKNNLSLLALTLFIGAFLLGSCNKDKDKGNDNDNNNNKNKGVVIPTKTTMNTAYDDTSVAVEFTSTRGWSVTLYDGISGTISPSVIAKVSKTITPGTSASITGSGSTNKQNVYVTYPANSVTTPRVFRAVFTPANYGARVTVTITQYGAPGNPDTNPLTGIETVIPASMGNFYTTNFNRYTKVTTPNGGAIHIVAQNLISDEQMIRCRGILQHYLKNYPGSTYGADKSAVANKMAENEAILCLLNGQDDESNPVAMSDELTGQPLFQNEIQVEGGSWYINQNYEHRDASYEEILHLVHDMGIGVDGTPAGPPGALPAYQTVIRGAQENAISNNYAIWPIGGDPTWITDITDENSLSQEYLAAVVDAYYGLWGAWRVKNGSMWGMYKPKVRDDMASDDPMGAALMDNKFFHPYLTYNARIDPGFNGTFSLKFNSGLPYTNHSRYLKDITLTGSNNISVVVNEMDNNITGNAGTNTVIFSGDKSEYTITTSGDTTTVKDNTSGRDGDNTLKHIDKLTFTNGTTDI